MSDYHVLVQDFKKRSVSVVYHLPIPAAGTNEAGIGWRDAAVESSTTRLDDLTILPVCATIRSALGVPDDDEPDEPPEAA